MKRLARAISLIALASCAPSHPGGAPATPKRSEGVGAPGAWVYEIEVADDARALDVAATFPAGSAGGFGFDPDANRFAEHVAVRVNGAWRDVRVSDGAWAIPCAAGCEVHYRFRLGDAARGLGDPDAAMEGGDGAAIEAPPSTWLLRPSDFDPRTTYRFHVHTRGDARFATGVHVVPGAPDTYGASTNDIESAPYSLFGKLRLRTLVRPDVSIELAMLDGKLALDDAAIDRWIDLSARAIDAYYGHFPVTRLLLVMMPHGGGHHDETVEGRTLGGGGATILLGISERMTAADIPHDWVLTHEMTHLASPSLPRDQHWLEEGIATYVEPIARAEVGTITPEEVWRGLVDGLPNGEPGPGDRGLDHTHSWGRTYWGGAMFCLLADVEIRKRTQNRASFETALRGVLDGLGNAESRAPLEDLLRAGDRATGVPVLEELHARLGEKAETIDLDALWEKLGVRATASAITYDDTAPLAAIRRAIGGAKATK